MIPSFQLICCAKNIVHGHYAYTHQTWQRSIDRLVLGILVELRLGTAQRLESRRLLLDLVRMDPEQLVAQLAELRTQNQQLHQALQQVQQQQSLQQGLVQALLGLPQSLAQTVGAAVLAAASPVRANPTLVDTKGVGKPPPLKNTESEFVSWARRTESIHPGARDVLTWAVERESATEANAATEVVMPLDTLRMLADQLYTVLMTLAEGESFDILVGSGSGDGLEAWRCLHERWDPLTTGRARGLLREILSLGRAKLELQGALERLEDLMRRDTQGRDAWTGRRHALAEDIRMAALEALLSEELERHCQLQRSRLDAYQKLREEVVLYAEASWYVASNLGQVSKAREDRDDPMDVGGFGQWKGRRFSKWERIPLALAKEREQEKMEKMVQNHRDERTHRKFKVSVGIAGKQVINLRTAGQTCESSLDSLQCGYWSRRNRVANERGTTHMRKFQVLQVAITKLQQVKWSKDRDGFGFVVKVFGDINCT